jgi:hypothetical protein
MGVMFDSSVLIDAERKRIDLDARLLAIIGKRIFLDFRRPATGHANLVSGVGSAEMDRSSG